MKIRLTIIIALLMFLSFPGNAQECMRLVRGTVKALDNQPLSHIVVSTDYGDSFSLDKGGYFELRVSSKCHYLTFKADGHSPDTKEVDGSYLMVKLVPGKAPEKNNASDFAQTQNTVKETAPEQKPEELKKEEPPKPEPEPKTDKIKEEEPQEPAPAMNEKGKKKIPYHIKACYDEIQDIRNSVLKSESTEDLKEISLQVGALSRRVHDYEDADLKLELNQLLKLLKQKFESLNQK